MEEREALQAQAVEEIENDIKLAQAIREEPTNLMEKIRKGWDEIAYRSNVGTWAIKIASALVVFLALLCSMRFGAADRAGLLNEVVALLPGAIGNSAVLLPLAAVLIALLWMAVTALGVVLCAVLLYLCYGGIAPVALLLAFFFLLLFQFEDRPVSALLIALPALTFLTSLQVGLFLVVLAAFASTRKHNGVVRSLGLVYFALLELCRGSFGIVTDSYGKQILPTIGKGIHPLAWLKSYFHLLETGSGADHIFGQILLLLAIFFVVGLIFAKLLDLRFARNAKPFVKKMQLDLKDGIIFAILLALLCLTPTAVFRFSILREFPCGYGSMVLQVLAAYVVTRPFAGRSPNRGDMVLDGDKNYIFVSYAHSDLDRIKPYLKILDQKGYEFWYDDSIRTGTEWQGVIASNLANCTCFLAFISRSSIVSEYCLKEINYATSKKKPMAVIMLDDVMLPPVLEMHLASLQAVQRDKYSSDSECMQKVFEMEQLDRCKN